MTSHVKAEVLDAWTAWDERPHNSEATNALVRAEQALGLVYGHPHQHVHAVLVAWRMGGRTPRGACIDAYVAGAQRLQQLLDA